MVAVPGHVGNWSLLEHREDLSFPALEAGKEHGAKVVDERPRLGKELQLVKLHAVFVVDGVGALEAIGAFAQTLGRDCRLDDIPDSGRVLGFLNIVVLAFRVHVNAALIEHGRNAPFDGMGKALESESLPYGGV